MAGIRAAGAELPSAVALLRGVESARTRYDSLRATLEVRGIAPASASPVECLVEMTGARLRFEIIAGNIPGQVVIRDDDVFRAFRRVKQADVNIYNLEEATSRGEIAFDPRVLGLSDLMSCNLTVKPCLWYDHHESLDVVGRETLHGAAVWRVRAKRGDDTAEFWIEEPSFRVYRKTVKTPYNQVTIESEFDSDKVPSPFPSRVVAKRRAGQSEEESTFVVKALEVGTTIPSDRFTLKSLNLPVNTMISDYRISRIVGYWDGEGISKNPVYAAELPAPGAREGPMGAGRRWVLILSGTLLLILIVVFVARRYRQVHP